MLNNKYQNEPTLEEMQASIVDAGGLFYQYRACRNDAATLYDIENIKNGVVYAQTPLNMNDPFDSVIGFSSDIIYDECINLVLDFIECDNSIRGIVALILKYRVLNKFVDLIDLLKSLKQFVLQRRSDMHMNGIPLSIFINKNM